MTRVKTWPVTKKRHKKIIKLAKGFRWWRSNLFRLAKNAVMKSGLNSYRDRRLKKRDFRSLWITRISAYLQSHWKRYSLFMNQFSNSEIYLNRKMLSDICSNHPEIMDKIVDTVEKK